jgi:hypothetical protein
MSNKKVTDLNPYTATEISQSGGVDLFIITDLANQETKKITAYELGNYTKTFIPPYTGSNTGSYTGSFSGSLFGTASYANSALSASYLINQPSGSSGANVGAFGIGVYKQVSAGVLQFKNLNSGQNITLVNDLANDVITINAASTLTTPGGAQYSIQYNAPGSVFGGNSGFTYTPSILGSTPVLSVNGNITGNIFTSTIGSGQTGFVGTASYANNANAASTAVTASFATTAANAVTASYVQATNGVLSSYSLVYTTLEQGGTSASQVMSITVTPKTPTSKFLINVNLCLSTRITNQGTATAGLYKDTTALLPAYINVVNPVNLAFAIWPLTYIDTATDLSPRTYNIKLSASGGGNWQTNAGGTSTMTILEINY